MNDHDKGEITRELREGPADDETIAAWIIERKGWDADDALRADVLKRARDVRHHLYHLQRHL